MPSVQPITPQSRRMAEEAAALQELGSRQMRAEMLRALAPLSPIIASSLETLDPEAIFTLAEYRRLVSRIRRWGTTRVHDVPPFVRELETAILALMRDMHTQAATLAVDHVNAQLQASVDREAVAVAASASLLKRVRPLAASGAVGVWLDIKKQFHRAATERETVEQMATRLQRLGGKRGKLPTVARGPATVASNVSAAFATRGAASVDRIVRTETAYAYNSQALITARIVVTPQIVKTWEACLDWRNCLVCRHMHGESVAPGESFSCGTKTPPIHPRCRCIAVYRASSDA